MAGAGYKLFATGDVLTAAQVNTYLMQQTVMVFASSAARTSALSGVLAEGMVSYLQDTNTLEVYDGAAWVGATGDITALTAGTGISISSATGPVPTVTNAMATEITAKGDLIVGTGSATFDNLAAGSNGETLVADSSTSTGLRYGANFAAGKNKIINGDFSVWQRGTSFSADGYTADRWRFSKNGGTTATISRQTFTPGAAPAAPYESQYFARYQRTAGAFDDYFLQRVEDARTLANTTSRFSFWAKASANTTISQVYLAQTTNGSGGGGSGNFSGLAITTSWVRYTIDVSLPSLSGATIGAGSYVETVFKFGSEMGNITVDIWGVQWEQGSVATAFQTATGTIQGELAACQRYYQRVTAGTVYGTVSPIAWQGSATVSYTTVPLPVTMRTAPTSLDSGNIAFLAFGRNTVFPLSSVTLDVTNSNQNVVASATISGGTTGTGGSWTGNNNSAGYLGFSAEL